MKLIKFCFYAGILLIFVSTFSIISYAQEKEEDDMLPETFGDEFDKKEVQKKELRIIDKKEKVREEPKREEKKEIKQKIEKKEKIADKDIDQIKEKIVIEKTGTAEVETDEPADFNSCPRVPYRILKADYEFLKDERFRGIVFPERIINVPPVLSKFSEKGSQIVIAGTNEKKYTIYVIIPKNKIKRVVEFIAKKKPLYFLYTPVALYKDVPVVKLIDGKGEKKQVQDLKVKKTEPTSFKTGFFKYFPAETGSKWSIIVGKNLRVLEYEITETASNYVKGVKREVVPGKDNSEKTSEYFIYYDKNKISTVEKGLDAAGNKFSKQELILQFPVTIGAKWNVGQDEMGATREVIGNENITVGDREYKDVVIVRDYVESKGQGAESFFAVTYHFYGADIGYLGCKIDTAFAKDGLREYNQIDEWFMQRSE